MSGDYDATRKYADRKKVIEHCAAVARELDGKPGEEIAAAILALKAIYVKAAG